MFRPILLTALLVVSCGDKDGDSSSGDGASTGGGSGSPPPLAWYETCGDPACGGYAGPYEGVVACTDQTEGAGCTPEGDSCDLENDCNSFMVCAAEDPKDQAGGCPVSRASTKTAIRYLGPREREEARQQLLSTRLATWRYRWDPPSRRHRLGFLIDDQPTSPAVQDDGQHVDLYGYASLTVAAVQAQDAELQGLRSELADTRAALAELQGQVAALKACE